MDYGGKSTRLRLSLVLWHLLPPPSLTFTSVIITWLVQRVAKILFHSKVAWGCLKPNVLIWIYIPRAPSKSSSQRPPQRWQPDFPEWRVYACTCVLVCMCACMSVCLCVCVAGRPMRAMGQNLEAPEAWRRFTSYHLAHPWAPVSHL